MTNLNQNDHINDAIILLETNSYFQQSNYNLLMSVADKMQQVCNCQDGEYTFLIQQAKKELMGTTNAN